MSRDPDGDFDHPWIPAGNPLRRHVLYRVRASALIAAATASPAALERLGDAQSPAEHEGALERGEHLEHQRPRAPAGDSRFDEPRGAALDPEVEDVGAGLAELSLVLETSSATVAIGQASA